MALTHRSMGTKNGAATLMHFTQGAGLENFGTPTAIIRMLHAIGVCIANAR